MAQYSPTFSDRSWVPTRLDSAMMSSLLSPTSGRRIGSSQPWEMTARFLSVWDETWPIASPVTIASASNCVAATAVGGAQHHALQHDLPEARRHALLDLAGDEIEVDRVEARPRPALPEVAEALRDRERLQLVRPAAEIAEDVVEGDAAPEHAP